MIVEVKEYWYFYRRTSQKNNKIISIVLILELEIMEVSNVPRTEGCPFPKLKFRPAKIRLSAFEFEVSIFEKTLYILKYL